jgi:hypothetical protein
MQHPCLCRELRGEPCPGPSPRSKSRPRAWPGRQRTRGAAAGCTTSARRAASASATVRHGAAQQHGMGQRVVQRLASCTRVQSDRTHPRKRKDTSPQTQGLPGSRRSATGRPGRRATAMLADGHMHKRASSPSPASTGQALCEGQGPRASQHPPAARRSGGSRPRRARSPA